MGLRLKKLFTNMITPNLVNFINLFSGLRSLVLWPNRKSNPANSLDLILQHLAPNHSRSLKVLGLNPQGEGNQEYSLSGPALDAIAASFPRLAELAFTIRQEDMVSIPDVRNTSWLWI